MKRLIVFISLVILCSVQSLAQQNQQKEIPVQEQMKMFVVSLAKKIEMTQNQKDSITMAYICFIDDVQKYRADNNAKVLTFLMNSREEKIKKIFHDEKKYDKYLLFLEDMKKQRDVQQTPPPQHQNRGQQNPMGNGSSL